MPKLHLLCLLLFLSSLPGFGQQSPAKGTVKGVLLDSLTAEPVEFATVAVQEPGKQQVLKAGYTVATGAFELGSLPLQPLELLISCVGYKSKVVKLRGYPEKAELDLGKITLRAASVQLKDVEIVEQRLLIKQEVDKLTYEVEADPESKTLTALDMLRKVPLITVDGQNKIELKGSGNFKVLVNGKPSTLFARDPSEVFRSMPANTIKRIEVITEPSAKYDAEGVGGILNVITVKQALGGYNGSVTAGGGLPENYRLNGFGTVKAGKFGAAVYFGGNRNKMPNAANSLVRKNFRNEGSELRQNGLSNNESGWGYADAQFSLELDSLNLFTLGLSANANQNRNRLHQQVELLGGSGELAQAYTRSNQAKGGWREASLSIDYQRSFANKPERLLTFSYKRDADASDGLTDIAVLPELNAAAIVARNRNDAGTVEHTGQLDYVHPIGKHTLETGLKTIIRLSESDYSYANVDSVSGAEVLVPALSNQFDYRQDIYAAYTTATLQREQWGLKLGARLEETRINADFITSQTKAKQDYLNLVPSVTLTRKLNQMTALKLSYNQRIERPGLWYLNPFRDLSDPRNISFGNPNLRPALSHNFDLSFNTFVKGATLGGSVFENMVNNSIQEYTLLVNDSVSQRTYANIGRSRVAGLTLFSNKMFFKKLSLRANLTLRYNWLSSTDASFNRNNQGVTSNFSAGFTYNAPKQLRISGHLGGSSRRVTLQGTGSGYLWNMISVSKALLPEEKLSLVFTVSSPFQRSRRWVNEINDPNFYQFSESNFITRSFNLSLSYKFGKLKDGVAKTKRGIENDDVSPAGGNTGGGGGK